MPRLQDAVPGDPQRTWQRHPNPVLIDPLHLAPKSTDRRHATSILERPIQGRREPHQTVGPKACDAGLAGTLDHAARHDLLGAIGGSCREAGANEFRAAAVLSIFPAWQTGRRGACGVADLLGLSGKPWVLAVDRTNWEFGKTTINILMVSVI